MRQRSIARFGTMVAIVLVVLLGHPADFSHVTAQDNGRHENQQFGYAFGWDESVWDVTEEVSRSGYDLVRLESVTGSLSIWSWDGYDGDPDACLASEADYYANEDPGITNWQIAEDENGDPLTGSDSDSAYGVFTLTYTDPDDENAVGVELVHYIECRTLVNGEASLIIFAISGRETYNDHIEQVLAVTNTITLSEESDAAEEAEDQTSELEIDPTPVPNVREETGEGDDTSEPGIDDSTFTSPSFGFTLDVPREWDVEDAIVTDGSEKLVLTNGTSTVTLLATDEYGGDLTGCIDFAVERVEDDPRYVDLELGVTSEGDPFQGNNDRLAYGNFVFTGEDDVEYTHFIECRHIVEGESVLILSQDVPYDLYTAERRNRLDLRDAIDLP